jgi:hypothetical protein
MLLQERRRTHAGRLPPIRFPSKALFLANPCRTMAGKATLAKPPIVAVTISKLTNFIIGGDGFWSRKTRCPFLPVALSGGKAHNHPLIRIHTPNGFTIEIENQDGPFQINPFIAMVAGL